jgi:hypothetical protein
MGFLNLLEKGLKLAYQGERVLMLDFPPSCKYVIRLPSALQASCTQ